MIIVECQAFLSLEMCLNSSRTLEENAYSYLTSMTDCHLSAGGQCVSEPFQLHDSIISSSVLLTFIILGEGGRKEQYGVMKAWLLGCISGAAVAY